MESEGTIRRIKAHSGEKTDYQRNRLTEERCVNNYRDKEERKRQLRQSALNESSVVILLSVFVLALWALVQLSLKQLVVGGVGGEFNATTARKHLDSITSLGPRPVGSHENEVLTTRYLLSQIEHIQLEAAAGHHSISVDVQRPTGSFSIDFLGGFTSYYNKITNVVVKLEPKGGASHLMLANCHFDSVPNSPGASDDAVSCAVMLEVLRSLASLTSPLNHGVVFLFNGAEENVLQASHGFITQHPWAEKIRAFINLEAAGVGGKEVVFQTGPENPWLVQAYVQAAKHPFASVVGQEVFQSGVIPSDTDFRIFRDFGNIPGIDLAFIENGFLYHTKFDTPDRIQMDSIQRAGDNILSVLKHLVMSQELADFSQYRHGNMVFYDVLGLYMVAYPARVGTIINYMATVATFCYLGKKAFSPSTRNGRYARDLANATGVAILSWFVTWLSVLIVAVLVTLLGRSMFWYNHFYASVFLYGSAAAGKMVLIHTLAKNLYYGNVRQLELGELFFDVSLLLWCCGLVSLNQRGLCSAYVPLLMVAFPLATKLMLAPEFKNRGVTVKYSVLYLIGIALPYVHFMFLIWVVFEIFTPILGRSGTQIPPDVVLASLISFGIAFLSSFFLHFIYMAKSTKWILTGLGTVFVVTLILVSCGMFFPYSGNPNSPRPKRVFLQHTTRTFHGLDGEVERIDSGLWINSLDYTGMQHVTPHIAEINSSVSTRCQEELPFCGFPWFLPVRFLVNRGKPVYSEKTPQQHGENPKNWYVPATELTPKSPVEFKLLSRQETEWGTVKLSFQVNGPSHMSLYLKPHSGAQLTSWSFDNGTPRFDLEGEYFIFYSHGVEAPAWDFWFEVQPPSTSQPSEPGGMVSLAIASHYFSGEDKKTPQLEEMLRRFPSWAFVSSWVSTYHMYRY